MNNYNNKINNNNIYLYICLIIIYIIYIYILYIIYICMCKDMLHDFLFFCLIYLITTIKYYVNLYFYKHTSNINSYF